MRAYPETAELELDVGTFLKNLLRKLPFVVILVGITVVGTYMFLDRLDPVTGTVAWQFDRPGVAVILVESGPAALAGVSDAWSRTTYCARMIVRVDAPAGTAVVPPRDPGVLAKAGQKIEIMPLTDEPPPITLPCA